MKLREPEVCPNGHGKRLSQVPAVPVEHKPVTINGVVLVAGTWEIVIDTHGTIVRHRYMGP